MEALRRCQDDVCALEECSPLIGLEGMDRCHSCIYASFLILLGLILHMVLLFVAFYLLHPHPCSFNKMMTSSPNPAPSSTSSESGYQGHLSLGDGLLASHDHRPTHPSLLQVIFNKGSYNSHLISLRTFLPGDLITSFAPHADLATARSYSTVQTGPWTHIELNSDLLYCNHSCDPNVAFHIGDAEDKESWKAKAIKKIDKGDTLTFCKQHNPTLSDPISSQGWRKDTDMLPCGPCPFGTVYPSTEWHMSQPFDCACGQEALCLGKIDGAHSIPLSTLKRYFINEHILKMKRQQIEKGASLDEQESKRQW